MRGSYSARDRLGNISGARVESQYAVAKALLHVFPFASPQWYRGSNVTERAVVCEADGGGGAELQDEQERGEHGC